ncbi:MAG: hypothetical protein AAFR96_09330 [Planctomycetota bacterium]
MSRLIEHGGLRAMAVTNTALVADRDSEPRSNAGNLFGGRPRISLGEPNPASGMALSIGGVAEAVGDAFAFADNDAVEVVLYVDQPVAGEGSGDPHRRVRELATLTVTMGTLTETVRVDGQDRTVRWADTIAVAMGSYGTYLFARYGLSDLAAFDDGANGIAELLIAQLPHVSAVVVDGTIASGRKMLVLDVRRAS